jgi:hypothetical protein
VTVFSIDNENSITAFATAAAANAATRRHSICLRTPAEPKGGKAAKAAEASSPRGGSKMAEVIAMMQRKGRRGVRPDARQTHYNMFLIAQKLRRFWGSPSAWQPRRNSLASGFKLK